MIWANLIKLFLNSSNQPINKGKDKILQENRTKIQSKEFKINTLILSNNHDSTPKKESEFNTNENCINDINFILDLFIKLYRILADIISYL